MPAFLVDVNLPYRFSYWRGDEFLHQRDLGEEWDDAPIWEYARANNLTIITKDRDFADRIAVSQPPPSVLWLRYGNCSLRQLHQFLKPFWAQAMALLPASKPVTITDGGVVST